MILRLRHLMRRNAETRLLLVPALCSWAILSCRSEQPVEWSSAVSVVVAEWREPNRAASFRPHIGALAIGLPWESSGPPERPVKSRLWVFDSTPARERLDSYDVDGGVFQQSIARYGATGDTLLCAVLSRDGDVFLGRRSVRSAGSWDVGSSLHALISYPSLDLANLRFARSSKGVIVVGPARRMEGQLAAIFLPPEGAPVEWSSGPISRREPSEVCFVEGSDEIVAMVRLFANGNQLEDWILNASGESWYSPVPDLVDQTGGFSGLSLGDAMQTPTGVVLLEYVHRGKVATSYRVRDLQGNNVLGPSEWVGGNLYPLKLVLSDSMPSQFSGIFGLEIAVGGDTGAAPGIFVTGAGSYKFPSTLPRVNGPLIASLERTHSLAVEYVSFDYRAIRVALPLQHATSPPAKEAPEVPRSGGD